MPSTNTEVLIAGAGPTGLMAACQLSVLGIKFRIIDKNKEPAKESRALAIHAASMELFSQLGIADQFLELGKRTKAVNYLVKGKVAKRIPISDFGQGLSAFPYILMLEQSKTEQLLVDFLEKRGHTVERETELVSFSQSIDNVEVIIKKAGQPEVKLEAKYLIGADGAKSVMRHILDIPFGGQTYPADLFVLDCKITWPLKDDEMYIAFSDTSFAGFFPLPEGRCRVISFVPEEAASKEIIDFEDIEKSFAARMQMQIKLTDPAWISRYHSHHRYVAQFRKGRCFLAGDAAHIHSPVGAQGMNTGLQDAANLAWKLAMIIKNQAKENLLDTYNQERLPFARQLVKTTDNAFSITVSKSPFIKFMLLYVAPKLLVWILKIKFLAPFIFKTISQVGTRYTESDLVKNASSGSFPAKAPKPGERLPYLKFVSRNDKLVSLQDHVTGFNLHLFVFTGSNSDNSKESPVINIAKKYPDIISMDIIPFSPSTRNVYKALGISDTGCYLVRPDLHIAFRSSNNNSGHFEAYLKRFLN